MDDKIAIFKRGEHGDWRCEYECTNLCSEGFDEYIELPGDVKEFDAIFSVDRPANPEHFSLTEGSDGITLDTVDEIGFTGDAYNLLARVWQDGYRFLQVRF